MSRDDDLKVLYSTPPKEPKINAFDSIMQPCPLLMLLPYPEIVQLNKIAKDKRLAAKPKEKLNMIKEIMGRYGFKKLASGTNRIVFKYLENQDIVVKVAYDSVGLTDNLHEMYNQQFLKPFCTKVFEVSPCGTVGMFERVHLISSRAEFASIAEEVFDIIVNHLVGRYILDDFGSKFFMNWGVREGMHPVILDFPYCYELDGARIFCNRPNPATGTICGGEIDYDDGFNHLICKKCGKSYLASELRLAVEKKSKDIIIDKEETEMIVTIKRGDNIISKHDSTKSSSTYRKVRNGRPVETPYEYRERKRHEMRVRINRTSEDVSGERVDESAETASQDYDNSQFNQGWVSENVPSVDDMYSDIKVKINNPRKKKVEVSNTYGEFMKNYQAPSDDCIKYGKTVPVPEKPQADDAVAFGQINPAMMDSIERDIQLESHSDKEPIDTVAKEIHEKNEEVETGKTFFHCFEQEMIQLYQMAGVPKVEVTVFGDPDLVRRIDPENSHQTHGIIVVTSGKVLYNFIGYDKLSGSTDFIVILRPEGSTCRVIYKIENVDNLELSNSRGYSSWEFVGHYSEQKPIDAIIDEIYNKSEEVEQNVDASTETVSEQDDQQDSCSNEPTEEQPSKEEMYPNATQVVKIVYDTNNEEKPQITEDEILSEF